MKKNLKFCRDCKWINSQMCVNEKPRFLCTRPFEREVNLVDGELIAIFCEDERSVHVDEDPFETRCGKSGRHFEERKKI